MIISPKINLIIAVKGVEYQSIQAKLLKFSPYSQTLAIPAGLKAVSSFLNQEYSSFQSVQKISQGVLLLGLCGSLSSCYQVGQGVLYQGCGYLTQEGQWHYLECDDHLIEILQEKLGKEGVLGKGISCDRVITQPEDKIRLREEHSVDVVDMESFALLDFFQKKNIPVAIIRVVSDDCQQSLPDLTDVFSHQGNLNPIRLAVKMLQNPWASWHLICSSLKALKSLEKLVQKLYSPSSR